MTFIEKLRQLISENKLNPEFTIEDLKKLGLDIKNINNISNFDEKNLGSSNNNKKILKSKIVDNIKYFYFKN